MLLVAGFVLLAAIVLYWAAFGANAKSATAYGARIACSCRFIAGRELDRCRDDFVAGMALVRLSEDADEKSVTASLPLIASQTARYEEGPGCLLEPWEG